MRRTALALAILPLVSACSGGGEAPRALESLKARGFTDIAYGISKETAGKVELGDVTGRTADGRPFKARYLEATRQGSQWSSFSFRDYGDGELSTASLRLEAESISVYEDMTWRSPTLAYAADSVLVDARADVTTLRGSGIRVVSPSAASTFLPSSSSVVVRMEPGPDETSKAFVSASSGAISGMATATVRGPAPKDPRGLLSMQWLPGVSVSDLDARVDVLRPLDVPLPEAGMDRKGAGLAMNVATRGGPVPLSSLGEAWRRSVAGDDGPLAVSMSTPNARRGP